MKKYKVFVNGQNFLLNLDGESKKVGFYATRFVEADNEDEAEGKVIGIFQSESQLRDNILNDNSDNPMMYVESVSEVKSFDDVGRTDAGYSFYYENNEIQ